MTFIEGLETPEGPMHYNDVFDRAVDAVVRVWSTIGEALHTSTAGDADVRLAAIPNGNLDTGVSLIDRELIFWRVA